MDLFLNELLDDYKNSDEKKEILDEFLRHLWNSKCTFAKYSKYFTYKVNNDLLNNNQELIDLFEKYNRIEYKVARSQYNKQLSSFDYIRIHINNMYGYLTDKDVYYKKDYYKLLLTPKNEYFKAVKLIKNGEFNKVSVLDIKKRIVDSLNKAESIKLECIENKHNIKWSKYKQLVNGYIERIFENYIPIYEYEKEHGWDMKVTVDGWNEDNYVIKYICKSLTGYMRNYIRDSKPKEVRIKNCVVCGCEIEDTVHNKKYCGKCAKDVLKEQWKKASYNYYHKANGIYQYGI